MIQVGVEGWYDKCRAALHEKWLNTTKHGDGRRRGWACEIYRGCKTCDEHLSLPCSLAEEANEIGRFLEPNRLADEPKMFFRLYCILLAEFCDGLRDAAGLLGIKVRKPPKDVSVWANQFAKHRLNIRIQHHPIYLFADECGEEWPQLRAELPETRYVDRCGNESQLAIIDYDYFVCGEPQGQRIDLANDDRRAVIVVPRLMDLLDSTIQYFRHFVDACLENSELVKQFESKHFNRACF